MVEEVIWGRRGVGGWEFGVIGGGGCMFGMIWIGDGWDDWELRGDWGIMTG